jgi:hypothetical protein
LYIPYEWDTCGWRIDAHAATGSWVFPSAQNLCKVLGAFARWRHAGAAVDLEALSGYVWQNKLKFLDGYFARFLAKLWLNTGSDRAADAEPWIRRAVETDASDGRRWHVATDQVLRAEWLQQKGVGLKARQQLSKAIELFRECGADGWVKRTEEKLAQL